jgi:hypothetical protein
MADRRHHGESEHGHGNVAMPAMPASALIVIESEWRRPDVPQVCDGAAALASRSAKSLVIPTVSLLVQSAAQGKHPVIGIAQHAGSAKPRTPARRRWFKRWRLSDIRRRLGLPGHISEERTHASYALIPRIGSKGARPAASVDFTKREAGVVKVTCIITRLSPWSRTGTIHSAWRSRAGFVKSATLR